MRTNLAYIETVIDRETENRHENAPNSLTDVDRNSAAKAAVRVVAGFEVHDEAQERRNLDAMIASRRAAIDAFRTDRTKARERFAGLGITPLAIVPVVAWNAICDKAGLFRLAPDKNGRVGVAYGAFDNYMIETRETKRGMLGNTYIAASFKIKEATELQINQHALADWPAFLCKMFGGQVAHTFDEDRAQDARYYSNSNYGPLFATIVLPTAPADVQTILLKASSGAYLGLKVAAVAEAISFKQTPAQLLRNEVNRREAEARWREQIDADPIIYHEEGSAAAIIAQFGDFPIEQQVVDAVAASNDLIPDRLSRVDEMRIVSHPNIEQMYMAQANRELQAQQNMFSSQFAAAGLQATTLTHGTINSGAWTGR